MKSLCAWVGLPLSWHRESEAQLLLNSWAWEAAPSGHRPDLNCRIFGDSQHAAPGAMVHWDCPLRPLHLLYPMGSPTQVAAMPRPVRSRHKGPARQHGGLRARPVQQGQLGRERRAARPQTLAGLGLGSGCTPTGPPHPDLPGCQETPRAASDSALDSWKTGASPATCNFHGLPLPHPEAPGADPGHRTLGILSPQLPALAMPAPRNALPPPAAPTLHCAHGCLGWG